MAIRRRGIALGSIALPQMQVNHCIQHRQRETSRRRLSEHRTAGQLFRHRDLEDPVAFHLSSEELALNDFMNH